jgi:cell division septation protein DedD
LAINLGEQCASSLLANRVLTMVHNGPSKRKLGDVWIHLVVSACVLLGPPLLMVAGIMYLGSALPKAAGQHVTAEQSADGGAQRSNVRPDDVASLAFVITEQRPMTGKNNERLTTADVETTSATTEISAKVLEQLPAPRRMISSLTRAGAALQTLEAAVPAGGTSVAAVEEGPPPASARPVPRANESDIWVVQLSAQRTEAEAQSAFRAAQAKYSMLAGYQLLVRKKDQGERGTFYAAQGGPLARSEANELCDNLKTAGASCFVEKSLR